MLSFSLMPSYSDNQLRYHLGAILFIPLDNHLSLLLLLMTEVYPLYDEWEHWKEVRLEDIYSDEDEMYTPDEEEESEKDEHEEDDEDDSNVLEQPTSKKLPKTMSSFVAKHVNQPRKEAATIVCPMTRSGSMSESLKQVAQSKQKQKAHNFEHKKQQQQPTSKKNGLQSQKERYIVAEEGRKCIMEIVGARWRGYKCWVKKHHFYAYDTYEKIWEKRPRTILDTQFKDILNYWDFELVMELSNKNKSNRLKADDMHTLGPNSYALLRHELLSRNASTAKSSVGGPSSVVANSSHQVEDQVNGSNDQDACIEDQEMEE
ncbi:large T: Large T antigen [Bienertia sinuspersici]